MGTRVCPWLEVAAEYGAYEGAVEVVGRGLHSSTFRLNVSALCGIRGAFRGCLRGWVGGVREYDGLRGVCFESEVVQVELKSGRV